MFIHKISLKKGGEKGKKTQKRKQKKTLRKYYHICVIPLLLTEVTRSRYYALLGNHHPKSGNTQERDGRSH